MFLINFLFYKLKKSFVLFVKIVFKKMTEKFKKKKFVGQMRITAYVHKKSDFGLYFQVIFFNSFLFELKVYK